MKKQVRFQAIVIGLGLMLVINGCGQSVETQVPQKETEAQETTRQDGWSYPITESSSETSKRSATEETTVGPDHTENPPLSGSLEPPILETYPEESTTETTTDVVAPEELTEQVWNETKEQSAQILRVPRPRDEKGSQNATPEVSLPSSEDDLFDEILRLTHTGSADVDLTLEVLSIYPQVMDLFWLLDGRLAVISHCNPSMDQYTVVTPKTRKALNWYGIGFVWNQAMSKLYYIETAPHFSQETNDKLRDSSGRVLYEIMDGERLLCCLAISPDEQYFVIEVETLEEDRLFRLLKRKGSTARWVADLGDAVGIPTFIDNNTLEITLPDDSVRILYMDAL